MRQTFTFTIDQNFGQPAADGFRMSAQPQAERLEGPAVIRFPGNAATAAGGDGSPAGSEGDCDAWDMRSAWTEFVRPSSMRAGRSESSRREHRTALKHWEAIFATEHARAQQFAAAAGPTSTAWTHDMPPGGENPRTIYPRVQDVDFRVLSYYRDHLLAPVPGIAVEATEHFAGVGVEQARKCLSAIKLILKHARRHGLITNVPDVDPLPRSRSRPGLVTMAEVESLLAATDAATWPQLGDLSPGFVWSTWIGMFWVYGARTQDFAAFAGTHTDGLLWEEVAFDRRCPDQQLRLTAPAGWIDYQPNKTARSKGERITLPLHGWIAARLARFDGLDGRRVFPNGRSKKKFAAAWRAIRSAAGVAEDVTIADTGSGKRSIRKACSNNWDDVREGLGEWVLGHARKGVNATHYKQPIGQIVDGLRQLAVPAAMKETGGV